MSQPASARDPADTGDELGASTSARGVVFMSDPSAEAEQVARLLRAAGHAVLDVPMSLLVARVAVQKPAVLVIDADVEGAREAVAAVRALEGGGAVDLVLFGVPAADGGPGDRALGVEPVGFFGRPVDLQAVVRKIDALTSGARSEAPSRPPPSRAPASPPLRRTPDRSSPLPPAPLSVRPAISIQGSLSAELEALLEEAEQRIGSQRMAEVVPPTPEEEIERVLPAALLASLDEPILDDDDDSAVDGGLSRLGPASARGAPRGPGQTNAGHVLTPSAADVGPHTVAGSSFLASMTSSFRPDPGDGGLSGPTRGGRAEEAALPEPPSIGVAPTLAAPALGARSAASAPDVTAIPRDAKTGSVAVPEGPVTVVGAGDPPRLLASAVAGRASGTLSFEDAEALRRVVLRDGDIVTAASSAEEETLLAFLTVRGDIRREQVKDLAGKIAPFGRHAGAALVAHGLLRQDQLWTALRGHAEWVLGRALNVGRGTARIEAEAPGRLRQEPSVFGGSSGAEVLVEVARRVIAPEEAIRRLGGLGARVTHGRAAALLTECALAPEERALVDEAHGLTVDEIMGRAAGPDAAAMLYMLTLLGVADVAIGIATPTRNRDAALGHDEPHDVQARADDVLALDLTAVRERVRARHELVCEGDYFTLLGVSRDATGYEVRRAFLELRRAFEPSRILTPEILDLEEDVRTILSVLDEAYEILRDGARRERYRRALGDGP